MGVAYRTCPKKKRIATLVYKIQKDERRESQGWVPNPESRHESGLSRRAAHIFHTERHSWIVKTETDDLDRDITKFTLHQVHNRTIRMPFGLNNLPSTLQRAMEDLLSTVKRQIALVYLHAVVIFLRSVEDHLDRIQTTLGLQSRARMSLELNNDFCSRTESIICVTTYKLGDLVYHENV